MTEQLILGKPVVQKALRNRIGLRPHEKMHLEFRDDVLYVYTFRVVRGVRFIYFVKLSDLVDMFETTKPFKSRIYRFRLVNDCLFFDLLDA